MWRDNISVHRAVSTSVSPTDAATTFECCLLTFICFVWGGVYRAQSIQSILEWISVVPGCLVLMLPHIVQKHNVVKKKPIILCLLPSSPHTTEPENSVTGSSFCRPP